MDSAAHTQLLAAALAIGDEKKNDSVVRAHGNLRPALISATQPESSLRFVAVCMRLKVGGTVTSPWLKVLAGALVIIGMAMFFINGEAIVNGDAVECDGSPMRPGQWCVSTRGGESLSYDEEKKNEARGELVGYAGVGVGTLGIVLLISRGIATRRTVR